MKNLSFFFIILLVSCTNTTIKNENQSLKIAIAANMQFAVDEIAKEFTRQTDIQCELIVGSSGKLTAQIEKGAPFDIFISANMMYPQRLIETKKAVGDIKIYALGKLVMWTLKDNVELNFDALSSSSIQHIAIANPETAPYGIATLEVLEALPDFGRFKNKLVYGESITQANQFILTQSAEVGFTALSVVLSPEMKGKGKWIEVESSLYSPIKQGAVIINDENPASQKFFDFLSSDIAKEILTEYGYEILD